MNFLAELSNKKLKSVAKPTIPTLKERLVKSEPSINTPTQSYDQAWSDGCLNSTTNHHVPQLAKVMVLQRNCVSPQELDNILIKEAKTTGRKVDFIILPEGAHHEGKDATIQGNSLLRNLAKIVAKHKVWACLGTMSEAVTSTSNKKTTFHCTALIVGPDGKLVTTYRKRATQGNVTTPGERPCCFDTKFGKVGVMICYDAENQQFLQEALAMKPVLMLNPIHISAGALSNSNSNRERHAQWRTSLESMGRYIDRVVSKENGQVTWIRCDQPYPIGAGTSQITSGCRTQQVSTSGTTNWSVLVEIGSKSPAPRWICRAPTRDRTLDIDNCGNRYTLKNIEIALHDETEEVTLVHQARTMPKASRNNMHYPKGILQIINKNSNSIVAEIDLFRMVEITRRQDQSTCKGETKTITTTTASSCSSSSCSNNSSTDGTPIQIENTRFHLALEQQEDLSLLKLIRKGEKNNNKEKEECRHVFVGPSNGISTFAYLNKPGVIVSISKTAGSSVPNLLLEEIDGKSSSSSIAHKKNIGKKRNKLVLTVWEFSQHRHPVPLHDLLS